MTKNSKTKINLNQSAVLLTGGTSGIGLASAKALALAGVEKLMLVGRSVERGHAAVETVLAEVPDVDVRSYSADVTTPTGACEAAEACHSAFGSIDVLVGTVGNAHMPKILHKLPIEEIPPMLSAIINGAILPPRAVLPFMMKQGHGSIMCVASDAAKLATPGEVIIGAAMASIVMFCRGLANEAKRSGIRVNAITPSIVRGTPLYDQVMADEFSAKMFARAEQLADLGVATADDLADLVVFLSSPASSLITGQTISVTGGISAI
ncbi:MAG: 2-hydroxycyclohexanecarboxyl-CoA dehydrogenase [Parasphingorhabdus sp.]|jgi:2-hydroxycyclohexanecarboxyl-CoA dehydrogenase